MKDIYCFNCKTRPARRLLVHKYTHLNGIIFAECGECWGWLNTDKFIDLTPGAVAFARLSGRVIKHAENE